MPKKPEKVPSNTRQTLSQLFLLLLVALMSAFALFAYKTHKELSVDTMKNPPSGIIAPSPTASLTTFNDALPPTVILLDQSEEETETSTIRVGASDNSGMSHVEFYVDDKIVCRDTVAPFECTVDPSRLTENARIEVKGFDVAHNMSSVVKVPPTPTP